MAKLNFRKVTEKLDKLESRYGVFAQNEQILSAESQLEMLKAEEKEIVERIRGREVTTGGSCYLTLLIPCTEKPLSEPRI